MKKKQEKSEKPALEAANPASSDSGATVVTPVPDPPSIPFSEVHLSKRYDDVYEDIAPDEIGQVRWKNGGHEFICKNGVCLRIAVVMPGVLRLRYSPDGHFERDFSYGISPDFAPAQLRATLSETPNEYLLATEGLQIVVAKTGLKVRFYDQDDQLLREDAEGYSARRTIMEGWNQVKISQQYQRKEVFYGLGDKTCAANLYGQKVQNWCTDSFAYGHNTDPLYRAIPFFYGLHQGLAYGVFMDNTYRTHFDFGATTPENVSFWADGGEMNYYFIAGNTLLEVSKRFATLTGTHALPPLWALGYHQCRWSYYPEARVREIADTFRKLQIPCDAIYLDIDYMEKHKCFTWDKRHFPDLKGMIDDLREQGFETVMMIDPGLKQETGYHAYDSALQGGHLVCAPDGEVAHGPVWPGFCGFPDYTRPETRRWWGELYRELYNEMGTSGFWNDMNEPAVFYVNHKTLPDQVRHHYDGAPCSHRKAHNIYGQQMTRASWEGFQHLQPEKRPFLLTRATYAGGQRYSAVWTGDNCASWEHLTLANVQCQRLSVSGISFCGTDIGGFAGDPDGELYVRWLQLSVFHPLMRTHTMGGHATGDAAIAIEDEGELDTQPTRLSEQEPWSFGEKWTILAQKAIELRYHLLPVLYTAMWQHTQDGTPVLRHAAFEDELDPRLSDSDRDFVFGEHLFVSPVVQPKIQRQMVYLPKGLWYYFWTGQPSAGETFVNLKPEEIPFFVRAGAVLATYPVRQWVNEKPVDELKLYIYYKNGSETTHLYEDAGEGYAYRDGAFCLSTFKTVGDDKSFALHRSTEGTWPLPYPVVKIFLMGFPTFAKKCLVDGEEVPIREIRLRDRSLYTLDVKAGFGEIVWKA
jgi:alpha-glucosidase